MIFRHHKIPAIMMQKKKAQEGLDGSNLSKKDKRGRPENVSDHPLVAIVIQALTARRFRIRDSG